jgi:hypothetical protein
MVAHGRQGCNPISKFSFTAEGLRYTLPLEHLSLHSEPKIAIRVLQSITELLKIDTIGNFGELSAERRLKGVITWTNLFKYRK